MITAVICPSCGRETATARRLEKYQYKESGIPNLWLEGGVTQTICARCGKRHIRIEKEAQLLQVLAMAILENTRPLTGGEMKFLRGAAQLSQAKLADAIHRRRETIAEREAKMWPGIGFAEEVTLRLVILQHFREQLRNEEMNFLTEAQRRRLDDFTRYFCDFSARFAERFVAKHSKLVARLADEEVWSLDEAA